jgi:diguanylate cyclase (GGDEF)-like protein/PAS domain S-box-containing protein
MRKNLALFFSVVVLITLGLFSFYEFSGGLFHKSSSDAIQILRSSLTHNVYALRYEIYDSVSKVQIIADSLAQLPDTDRGEARRKLREFNDSAHFKHLLLVDKEGNGINGSGYRIQVKDSLACQKALQGSTYLDYTDFQEDESLILSTPVIKKGKVAGAVLGQYDSFSLAENLNLENFQGEGYACLIKKNGSYLIRPGSNKVLFPEENNMFTALSKVSFEDGKSLEEVMNDIKLNREGHVTYAFNGQRRLIYYMPLGINDWYLVKAVTDKFLQDNVKPVQKLILSLSIKLFLIACLLVLIVYTIVHGLHQRRLQESLKYKLLAENVPSGVAEVLVNDTCQVQYANSGFYNLLGYDQEDFEHPPVNGNLFGVMKSEDVEAFKSILTNAQKLNKTIYFDNSILTHDGQSKWIAGHGRVISVSRKGTVLQAVFTDVTADKLKEAALLELSKIDKMTGLYNKVSVQELIEAQLKIAGSGSRVLAVLDIDDFKEVNDTYGHLAGDDAIIAVARMLKHYFESRAIIGRIGGDEFVVYLPPNRRKHDLEMQFSQLQLEFKNMYYHVGCRPLSCSIGVVAGYNLPSWSYDRIFNLADKNLYQAKKSKGSAVITRV